MVRLSSFFSASRWAWYWYISTNLLICYDVVCFRNVFLLMILRPGLVTRFLGSCVKPQEAFVPQFKSADEDVFA